MIAVVALAGGADAPEDQGHGALAIAGIRDPPDADLTGSEPVRERGADTRRVGAARGVGFEGVGRGDGNLLHREVASEQFFLGEGEALFGVVDSHGHGGRRAALGLLWAGPGTRNNVIGAGDNGDSGPVPSATEAV